MSSFFGNTSSKKKEPEEKMEETPQGDSLTDHKTSDQENWFFRRALLVVLGSLLLMLFTFAVGFFFSLRGAEKTVVPNVVNMELVDALIDIQDKGLNSRIQVKYTQNTEDKGKVVSQSPDSGQSVKAGRRVTLTVSQGAVIEQVGDYRGMTLDEVKLELQTVFASFQAMIQIGEVVYQYNEKPEGEIIAQDPEEGTEITGLTKLNLVVSRGMEEGTFTVDNYTGMEYSDVIVLLAEENIPFLFHIDDQAPAQGSSIVFKQVPAIGELVSQGTPLEFYINRLSDRALNEAGRNTVFGLLEYQLPEYMVPMTMRLERTVGAMDPEVIFEMKHPGGAISIPYMEQADTLLTLYVNGKEQISYQVVIEE